MSSPSAPTATPRISEALHQSRWIVGGFVLLVISSLIFGLLSRPTDTNPLSPNNPGPRGAMALAQVLQQKGVNVRNIYTTRDVAQLGEDDLLVVTGVADLTDKHISSLMKSPRTNLLFLGTFAQTNRLEPYAVAVGESTPDGVAPRCKLPAAFEAGPLHGSRGSLKPLRTPEAACYQVAPEKYAYLQFQRPGGLRVSFLADAAAAENREITQNSQAAFLLNLMLPAKNVGWIVGSTFQLPSGHDAGSGTADVIPPAMTRALILFFVALLVLALAKGRRLGRVITEVVPVVVHGAETVYGRARMYRIHGAFETAARHARGFTARRLGERLHLARGISAEQLCERVAELTGMPESRVHEALAGFPPRTGAELVNLLKNLNSLVETTKGKEHK